MYRKFDSAKLDISYIQEVLFMLKQRCFLIYIFRKRLLMSYNTSVTGLIRQFMFFFFPVFQSFKRCLCVWMRWAKDLLP